MLEGFGGVECHQKSIDFLIDFWVDFWMGSGAPNGRNECFRSGPTGSTGRPIVKGRVNPSPPLRPDWRVAPRPSASRPGQKGVGFQGLSGLGFLASPGLRLASSSWPFRGLSWPPWPPLASLGLVWPVKADIGLAWPALRRCRVPPLGSRPCVRIGPADVF